MKVALLQLGPVGLGDPDARREHVAGRLADLPPHDLVVAPELWPVGFFAPQQWAASAEPLDGPTYQLMAAYARASGAWVHTGSFVERGQGDRLHNTSLVLDPTGAVVLTYRKAHLFGHRSPEARLLTAGDTVPVAEVAGVPTAAATCYDLRFPALFDLALRQGARMLLVTSAWPAVRREHWRLLCRTRAVESQSWLLACDAVGTEPDGDSGTAVAGTSLVVDPWGDVVAEGPADQEAAVLAEIDPSTAATVRERFAVHGSRRDDLRPGRASSAHSPGRAELI